MWIEKNGPAYRIRDLVGGRKVTVKTGFRTKTEARARMVELEADKLRGDALVHRGGELTLDQWVTAWWPAYEVTLRPSSRVSAEGILRRYIRRMLGHVELDDLSPIAVQRWVADLMGGRHSTGRKLSPKTIANAHGLLHKLLDEAVAHRLIRSNPCDRTKLPSKIHHEMQFLTEQEAERLLTAIPPYWRPLILLLLGTGLRWGEAIGLRVRDVDVLGGKLHVRRNLQELADTAELVDGEPKTNAGRRTVTFNKRVAEALIPLVAGKESDDQVFLAPKGGMVRTRVFYVVWGKARRGAGLPTLRIHDLRHTHAGWLISANVKGGLTTVQRRLGHKSYAVTSDLYGHLTQDAHDNVLEVLDAALPEINFRGEVGEPGDDQPRPTEINRAERPAQGSSRTRDQA